MSESIGVTTTSGLPTDQVELLRQICLRLDVIAMYLKEMSGVTDEPSQLRQTLAKSTDIVVS